MADTSNPWSADGWNVTAQMAYLRANGQARADARARDAGTTVGGRKPVRAGAVPSGGGEVTKYVILKKFYQIPTAPSPFFLVSAIHHGVGVDMAAFITRELILPPAAPALGFNSAARVTLEKDIAVTPAAMGFSVAAVVDRFFQPTVNQAVGVSMAATIERSRELIAAPGLGIAEAVVLTTFIGGLPISAAALGINQATTLTFERDLTASAALGVSQATSLTREFDAAASPALGFGVNGALTVTLEQDIAAAAAVGISTAATLTRESDLTAAPGLGVVQAVIVTLTSPANLVATPTLGATMAVALTNDAAPLFVAVSTSGTGNRVMTSPDGITWTSRADPVDNGWDDVCWSHELGLFVAVANNGTGNGVMTSPDGINWTTRVPAANNAWRRICWSPELGLFVAVASSGVGNRVMTSPDGINWTSRTSAADVSLLGVCWSPDLNLFVAVGVDAIHTSPDGINWTARTPTGSGLIWRYVVWAAALGLFVAVASNGTGNGIMTSPDGVNWTARVSAADTNWNGLAWSPSLGLLAANSSTGTGNRIMTSPDGINWTTRASAADNSWASITWSPVQRLFVVVGSATTSSRVMTSPDGINWTLHTSAADNVWVSVTSGQFGNVASANDMGVTQAVSFFLEQHVTVAPALGFSTAAALTREFDGDAAPALGFSTAAALTREFDGDAAPALGIVQAVTLQLTNNFAASPALGVTQATTLTREFDALMAAALGVTQATTLTTTAGGPDSIFGANLVRWWTADAGVGLSGSNVNTWTDQTAAADVLSTAGAVAPTFNATGINGQKSITFVNTSSCALEGAAGAFPALGGGSGFTIFIVSKQHGQGNASDTARYLSVTGTGQTTDWNNTKSIVLGIQFSTGRPDANAVALWANGVPLSSTVPQGYVGPFVTDTIHRFGYMFDGVTTITTYDNGPTAVQTNTGQTIDLSTVGRMLIGGQVTTINTSEAVPADIAQIIVVNRKATSVELQTLDGYLKAKYSPGRTNPAFVNSGTATNVTVSASSQTPALPASRVTGNLLLAFAGVGFAGEVFTTTTTGWTRIYQSNASNRSCAVFARFVDGTEAAPVINLGTASNNGAYIVAQYSNVKSVLAWGATGGADGAGFPRTAPAVTTTDDNSTLVLAGWPAGAAVGSFGTPTSYTQDVNDNGANSAAGVTIYHQNMSTSGSVSSTWNSGGSGGSAFMDAIIELIAAG